MAGLIPAYPGHPLSLDDSPVKTWMPGTGAGYDEQPLYAASFLLRPAVAERPRDPVEQHPVRFRAGFFARSQRILTERTRQIAECMGVSLHKRRNGCQFFAGGSPGVSMPLRCRQRRAQPAQAAGEIG